MISRRHFCAILGASTVFPFQRALSAEPGSANSSLLDQARSALGRYRRWKPREDIVGIVDFAAPSHVPRFHLVNLLSGTSLTILVAHGKGSDPAHSGWLQHFSNDPGSEASSSGCYLTGDTYIGRHGQSRRLIGLDATNSNALERGLVIHPADYVSEATALKLGKIGRSEGCLAISAADHAMVLERLGKGCLIQAGKV